MIEEQFVSFDTAKLLKEAGFDVPTSTHYSNSGEVWWSSIPEDNNNDKSCKACSRPTLALAARWLREVHGIHVGIDLVYIKPMTGKWICFIRFTDDCGNPYCSTGWFDRYEEALETGLREAIKLIKK